MLCPVCQVDHPGPCPRLPKPPSQPALQQLTGWVPSTPQGRSRSNALVPHDPRISAELEMKIALARPAMMAASLREFLQKVYADGAIMQGPDNVAAAVYNLYSDGGGGGVTPAMKAAKQFFLAVWTYRTRYPVIADGFLQYTGVTLEGMVERCERPEKVLAEKYLTDFLYFNLGGGGVCRLYLNIKFGSIPNILSQICRYAQQTPDHGIAGFKSACPSAVNRADTIVVYCSSKGAAEKLGTHMLSFRDSFNSDVPGMTSRLDPHLGAALGAEPEQQATGMQAPPEGYEESAQSFGSIRSQLIAMAILNYNANTAVYGTGFDVFARFVCVAFRGYGLDPMKPGD